MIAIHALIQISRMLATTNASEMICNRKLGETFRLPILPEPLSWDQYQKLLCNMDYSEPQQLYSSSLSKIQRLVRSLVIHPAYICSWELFILRETSWWRLTIRQTLKKWAAKLMCNWLSQSIQKWKKSSTTVLSYMEPLNPNTTVEDFQKFYPIWLPILAKHLFLISSGQSDILLAQLAKISVLNYCIEWWLRGCKSYKGASSHKSQINWSQRAAHSLLTWMQQEVSFPSLQAT